MRVKLITHPGDPPHLHLEPESDDDRRTLVLAIAAGFANGAGYDPNTGDVIHVQIACEPAE